MRLMDCHAIVKRIVPAFAVLVMIASGFAGVPVSGSSPTWTEPVEVSSNDRVYVNADLEIGQNNIYVLTHEYGAQDGHPLFLYRSSDGGANWSETWPLPNVFRGEAAMCVSPNGLNDEVLIATNGRILKSVNNGSSFTQISTLPLPPGGQWWRWMDIGTMSSSMFGPVHDSQVFVAGSVALGIPWEGGKYKVFFTRSTDGGLTWSAPVQVCNSVYESSWPQMLYDGTKLYCMYQYNVPSSPYAEIEMSTSSDLGATWSAPKQLIARGPGTVVLWVHGAQWLDNSKALITVGDYGWPGISGKAPVGRYGYFNFADQTYSEMGTFEGSDWNVTNGVSARLMPDNTLRVAWLKGISGSISQMWYTTGTGTGLEYPPPSPVASFTVTVDLTVVKVNASASLDRNEPPLPLTYSWDFGDGSQGTGVTATHTYAANGTYTITLTVVNSDQVSSTASRVVSVKIAPPPPPPPPPIIIFSLDLNQGWNLVSIPVAASGYKASTLGLSTHELVASFNPATQAYDKIFIIGLSAAAMDFSIAPSTGYWVYSFTQKTLLLPGTIPNVTQARAITVSGAGGWFILGIASLNGTWHASDIPNMFNSTGRVQLVARFDPGIGYKIWIADVPTINNFALVPGQGYWCYCTASGTISYDP